MILYEMNLMEFAGSLAGASRRLDYLQDLGINDISLMPVTNIIDAVDWGYTPIGYFGVDERFGKRCGFQEFVDQAHERGIAVIVDAIYGHMSSLFGYEYLYGLLGIDNPIMGPFSKDMFGPSVDWSKPFAQDSFYTVNRHRLEVYHEDFSGIVEEPVPSGTPADRSLAFTALAEGTPWRPWPARGTSSSV